MSIGGWTPAARTPSAEALYAQAEAQRHASARRFTLSREVLCQAHAERFAGRAPPAEGLLRLADEAGSSGRLNALGERAVRRLLLALAGKYVRLEEHRAANPSVAARAVRAPVFIIGGWRTGSTLLHRALAATGALRGVAFWEWADPFVACDGTLSQQEAARASAEQTFALQYTLNPLKRLVHPAGADLAEECVVGMGADGKNWALPSNVWAPEYTRWLSEQDFTSSYDLHRYTLQMLSGPETDLPWVLKAPAHTPELATLLAMYPDARIIHLHRRVVDVVTSGANLFCVFQSTYSDQVDPRAVGAYQLETLGTWFERATQARAKAPETRRFLDVEYDALSTNPIGCIGDILEWLEIDRGRVAGAERFIRTTPHEKSYPYQAKDFGLDEGAIRERMATYRQYFGLDE